MTILNLPARKITIPLIALAFVISACDSSNAIDATEQSENFDIALSVAFIADDLELTEAEIIELQGAFDEHAGREHEPGFLWEVAARLQANLTDEQKQRLFERIANHPVPSGQVGNGHASLSDFMRRQGNKAGGLGLFGGAIDLTEDQVMSLKLLREQFGEDLRGIAQSVRDGSLDREMARTQMIALAEEMKAAVGDILTDEQKAALEAFQAEHEARRDARAEAEREAMISILGLDDSRISALDELRAAIDEERLGFRELLEGGATAEEIRVLAEAAHAAHQEALEGILNQTQYEIFVIHGALASRMKNRDNPGGFARPYGGPLGARRQMEG